MKKYEKYKDSGIDWIGDIPQYWKVKRLKDLVNPKITDGPHETPELVDDEDSVPFISAEAITENGINYEARGGNISVEQDKIYTLKCKPQKDDIFIVKSGSTTGRIGYVETNLNFNIWSPLALVRSNRKTSSRFLYYFLSSDCIQKQIQNSWSFGTQPNIGMGIIERLRLAIPEFAEQLAIANYLDDQIQKIDRLLSNKKAQAEKLKELRQIEINNAVTKGLNQDLQDERMNRMNEELKSGKSLNPENPASDNFKDSGIEWLGKIPKHWEVKRLKDFCSMNSGNTITSDFIEDEGEYPVYGGNGLRGYFNNYTHEGNYVLIGRQGALCGNINYAKGKFWASEHAVVLTLKKKFNTFWIGELLRNMNLNQYSQASAQPGLSVEKIVFLKVPVPPIEEQTEIANYLQKRTAAIDQLIKNIEAQIEKLQELRKIKIYEAVTGKIKVNEYGQK